MTSIHEVIARSRRPGGFSEHRRFTIAKDRGIEKMRRFALADPHHYILELIQSAVANGASFLNVYVSTSRMTLAYLDGAYRKEELARLFDFLFVSHDDVEHGSLRLLALGVNALMVFEPREVLIESGDGTLAGTTRIVIRGRDGVVEVGQPDRALNGTFVRATGLKRRKVRGRSALEVVDGQPREITAIRERCILSPTRMVVNDEAMFGYARIRTPDLEGYTRTVKFDEGDLYGTLGAMFQEKTSIQLVTHGVWVDTITYEERLESFSGYPLSLGGVIAFDPLRKTADHSRVVKDAHYEEMWRRLRMYVEEVRTGQSIAHLTHVDVDKKLVNVREAVQRAEKANGIVLTPHLFPTADMLEKTKALGESLGFPVFLVSSYDEQLIRVALTNVEHIVTPNFEHPDEFAFYAQPQDQEPARPWVVEPIDLPDLSWTRIAAWLDQNLWNDDDRNELQAEIKTHDMLKKRGLKATLYTQANGNPDQAALLVKVRICQRVVAEFEYFTPNPGQILVLDVLDAQPAALLTAATPKSTTPRSTTPRNKPFAALISEVVQAMYGKIFATQGQVARDAMAHRDLLVDRTAARIVLSALSREAIIRITTGENQPPRMEITLAGRGTDQAFLDFPIFETLTGTKISVRALPDLARQGAGLIYGVTSTDNAQLEKRLLHQKQSLVLKLDKHLEHLLITLLGAPAYVNLENLDQAVENQRQTLRHLQQSAVHGGKNNPLADRALFLTTDGQRLSYREIRAAQTANRLRMFDGVAQDDLTEQHFPPTQTPASSDQKFTNLAMNPFTFWLLDSVGFITSLNHQATGSEHTQPPLDRLEINEATVDGFLEIPFLDPNQTPNSSRLATHGTVIAVSENRHHIDVYNDVFSRYGITGILRIRALPDPESTTLPALPDIIETAAQHLLKRQIERLGRGEWVEGQMFQQAVLYVLRYAAQHLQMSWQPDGSIDIHLENSRARTITNLPIFNGRHGNPISLERILTEFQNILIKDNTQTFDNLDWLDNILIIDHECTALRTWLQDILQPPKNTFPTQPPTTQPNLPTSTNPQEHLAASLTFWLNTLRPPNPQSPLPFHFTLATDPQHPHHGNLLILQPEHHALLNPDHWLIRWALAPQTHDARPLAWLLLATYAHLNDISTDITNDDEQRFQHRVFKALKNHKLRWPPASETSSDQT